MPISALIRAMDGLYTARDQYAQLRDTINAGKGTRWADNPAVWTLRFEVAQ